MRVTNRSAAHGQDAGGGFKANPYDGGHLEAIPTRSADQGFTEFLTDPEMRKVRRVWWNQRALGFRLPAERGVVVLPGGAR